MAERPNFVPEGWEWEEDGALDDTHVRVRVYPNNDVSVKKMVQLLSQILEDRDLDQVFFDEDTGLYWDRPLNASELEERRKEEEERKRYADDRDANQYGSMVRRLRERYGSDPSNWPGM